MSKIGSLRNTKVQPMYGVGRYLECSDLGTKKSFKSHNQFSTIVSVI